VYKKGTTEICCHGCQKPSPVTTNSLKGFLSKKEEKKSDMLLISSTLPPTSERISKTLTTFKGICKNYTQIRDSMHYLLLIIWLIEVYDPTQAQTTPIIMMIMHRMI
jgi:hypothetical protein